MPAAFEVKVPTKTATNRKPYEHRIWRVGAFAGYIGSVVFRFALYVYIYIWYISI